MNTDTTWPSTILPHHRAKLESSGLAPETVSAAGIRSETDKVRLAHLLDYKRWGKEWGSALVIPLYGRDGTVPMHRVRPDHPPKDVNGKPKFKYLSPKGARVHAYFAPTLNGEVEDTDRILLVTEGELKSLCAVQNGFPCVGLTGVDCWHSSKSTALLPELEAIPVKGRRVFVAFDSDAVDNENVRRNERQLAAALKLRGAVVKIIRFPPVPNGEKVGLDDFLVANGAAELWRLIEQAEEPEEPRAEEEKKSADGLFPEVEAQRYLDATIKHGRRRLLCWRDEFWKWKRGCWRRVPDSDVASDVTAFLNRAYFRVSRGAVGNVLAQLRAQAHVASDTEAPCWLDRVQGSEWDPKELLVTKNVIVHLPTLKTVPVAPALFNLAACDFSFIPAAECPRPDRWLRFLNELWGDDQESIQTAQQWAGYCLTADTCQQKMLGLFGPKRSGKGTFVRVLRAVVGAGNVASPTLSSFAQNFGLWPLADKTLAVIGDARLSGRADAAVITERLLSITGEDALTLDRKYLLPVTVTLPTRIMIVSNELPKLHDASGALVSRMIVLRLTRSWYGREDPRLTTDLMAELPGILWWAIQGWQRLQAAGKFSQPSSSESLLSEWEEVSSPVGAFVNDRCEVAEGLEVGRDELYDAYKAWCEENGRRAVADKAGFGRDLHASVPTVGTTKHRVFGKETRYYTGLTLQAVG